MIYFPENIQNFNLFSVLDLSWEKVDKDALTRPYHALSYRVRGNALFRYDDKTVTAGSGDLIFVPQYLDYHLNAEKEILFCVHFTCDNMPLQQIQQFTPVSSIVFDTLFRSMSNVWSEKKAGYASAATSYFFKIIENIQTNQTETAAANIHSNMNHVLAYIHEHFTEPTLSIRELADIATASESHFRKQFKALHGISPLQYINDLRIKYACELITSHYYKIYEVAEKVGFTDTKYFSTVIKKNIGLSPRELLKRQ